MFFRLFRGHQAAVGTQQRNAPLHVQTAQLFAKIAHIAAHDGAHSGIGDRRQGPLIFLHFRQDDMGQGHRNAGKDFSGQFGHAALMSAVQIGVHQRNGDGLNALSLEHAELGADIGVIEGANF